jgi:2-amino-4-hydroxy-6-hydroxymethyldihydropteridine diphosphokinase
MDVNWKTCYLGLGSNLGDRSGNITRALDLLEKHPRIRVLRISSFHETAPVGISDSAAPFFINAAVAIETQLSPRELLETLKELEKSLGKGVLNPKQAAKEKVRRDSESRPYRSRVIDLDILLYGDVRVREPDLEIPHPRMKEREFVMQPLREVWRPT